jgi:hypothetical protein
MSAGFHGIHEGQDVLAQVCSAGKKKGSKTNAFAPIFVHFIHFYWLFFHSPAIIYIYIYQLSTTNHHSLTSHPQFCTNPKSIRTPPPFPRPPLGFLSIQGAHWHGRGVHGADVPWVPAGMVVGHQRARACRQHQHAHAVYSGDKRYILPASSQPRTQFFAVKKS